MSNRPTKAERKGLAKKARLEAQRRSDRARTMRRVYMVVGVLVVGGAIAVAIAYKPKPTPSPTLAKINSLAAAAGFTASQTFPDEGHSHVAPPQRVTFKTNPPTSGMHYSITGTAPANTGVWQTPVQDEYQVHNLEHHHTIIQYGPNIDPGVKSALEALAASSPYNTYVLMAPRPNMPANTTIALTVWDHMSTSQKPTNATAVVAFVKAWADYYRDHNDSDEGFIAGTPNP